MVRHLHIIRPGQGSGQGVVGIVARTMDGSRPHFAVQIYSIFLAQKLVIFYGFLVGGLTLLYKYFLESKGTLF